MKIMNCKYCGKETPEGFDVCQDCAETQAPPPEELDQEQSPIQPTESPFAQPTFEEPVIEAPNKKKSILLTMIAGIVALVLVAFMVLNLSSVKALWIKNLGSGEDYFVYVAEENSDSRIQALTTRYGRSVEAVKTAFANKQADIAIHFSDEAVTLLQDALSTDLDLSNYKDINLRTGFFSDSGNRNIFLELALGTTPLLDLDAIVDKEGNDIYLAVENLSDTYLLLENVLDELFAISPDLGASFNFPSEEVLNQLVHKYYDLLIHNIHDVEKTTGTLTIGDASQKVTTLRYAATEAELAKISTAILTELKEDEEIKSILASFADYMIQISGEPELLNKDELITEFEDAINDALEDIPETPDTEEVLFTLVLHINSKHKLTGFVVEYEGKTLMSSKTIYKGDSFLYEGEIPEEEMKVTGEGTAEKKVINGQFTLTVRGEKKADILLENVDVNLETPARNGIITIVPSAELLSDLFETTGATSTVVSMLEPSLRISYDFHFIGLAILSKENEFASVTVSVTNESEKEIIIPSKEQAIHSDDIIRWANTIDTAKVLELVDALKLPAGTSDILSLLIEYADEAGGLGNLFT